MRQLLCITAVVELLLRLGGVPPALADEAPTTLPSEADLTEALSVDDGCLAQGLELAACAAQLLQLRGAKVKQEAFHARGDSAELSRRSSREAALFGAFEGRVDAVIEEAFDDVQGLGGEWSDTIMPMDVTWAQCTSINWTEGMNAAAHQAEVNAMVAELGIDSQCNSIDGTQRDSDTCRAIFASVRATRVLQQQFPQGPRFVNYLLVDWGRNPSWEAGAVSEVDRESMPPRATVANPNGANGFGVCDIIRTVLTRSANQESTGTCGYVAGLAALSHKAPAKALKMSVRLMWTGRVTPLVEVPCNYIFDQQPGLVPFQDETGQMHPAWAAASVESACVGNAADCAASVGPPQNAGLAFMWAQSLISSFSHELTQDCPAPEDGPAKLNYPGQDPAAVEIIGTVQGQVPGSALWSCNAVIDPAGRSCNVAYNMDTCYPYFEEDTCQLLFTYQYDPIESNTLAEHIGTGLLENLSYAEALEPVAQQSESMRLYVEFLKKITASEDLEETALTLSYVNNAVFWPSATSAMLEQACSKEVAMLILDANPLQLIAQPGSNNSMQNPMKGPYYPVVMETGGVAEAGECNHMVYVEACDAESNSYTLWTWGTQVYVTEELLLGEPFNRTFELPGRGRLPVGREESSFTTGIVCGVVYADDISFAPGAGGARPGGPDWANDGA